MEHGGFVKVYLDSNGLKAVKRIMGKQDLPGFVGEPEPAKLSN